MQRGPALGIQLSENWGHSVAGPEIAAKAIERLLHRTCPYRGCGSA